MKFNSKDKKKAPVINITNLIDVMFLLVIFVLLSAKFEPEGGIGVDLPQGKSKEVPHNMTYSLVISHDGTIYLEKEKVSMGNLPLKLKEVRKKMKDPVLVIKADKSVDWERIVAVTDTAKLAGQSKINFKIKP